MNVNTIFKNKMGVIVSLFVAVSILTACDAKQAKEAAEIAMSAPLAVRSIRATLREGLADAIKAATDHEAIEQAQLQTTADWKEGVAAMAERRTPNFQSK